MIEALQPDPEDWPMREWHRRADRAMCIMLFEGVRSPVLKQVLAVIYLPFFLIYLFGYCRVRLHIDIWRVGGPFVSGEGGEA
jgi:hypothetical protein